MKKSIIWLMVFWLCCLSNTVFAAHWIYIGRDSDADLYVDCDTVIKKEDELTFWSLQIFGTQEKLLTQQWVKMDERRLKRGLSGYKYDADNVLKYNISFPPTGVTIGPGSLEDKEIDVALSYASEDQNSDDIPVLPGL